MGEPVRWGPYVSGLDCDICGGLAMIRAFGSCPFHPIDDIVADLRQRWWAWWRALRPVAASGRRPSDGE